MVNESAGTPEPRTPEERHRIQKMPLTEILDEMDANIRAVAEAARRAEEAAKAARGAAGAATKASDDCLLYTSPSPRDQRGSRMPSSA